MGDDAGLSRRGLFGLGLARLGRELPAPAAADADLKARVVERWSRGDYGEEIGRRIEPAAIAAARATGAGLGMRVLDVAAGDGSAALAAASRGARVTACDITPAMVERGRARSARVRAEIDWHLADAEALPFADHAFDAAFSSFGVIVASRPRRAVRELFRVVRPGGAVAITAWTPGGFLGRFRALVDRHAPPRPGAPSPIAWGDPDFMRERLEPHAETDTVELRTEALTLRYETADEMFAALTARGPVEGAALDVLRVELLDLLVELNEDPGAAQVQAEYVLAVARTPA
jgi:SAM-dependent methyltransferase